MARSDQDAPRSVRVRTDPDEGLGHRFDAIKQAADRFDCNRSDAIAYACESVGPLLDNIEQALANDDLPPRLARELAEEISTRHLTVNYEGPETSIDAE